jgi:hypothetical protein
LTVIVSQSHRRDVSATELEEGLLAELMMAQGMDATLIGPLEHVTLDSTDFLCLASFQHSLVLVSWLETQQVAAQWQRLGLHGCVVAMGEGRFEKAAGRTIHHLQLRLPMPMNVLVQPLKQLLNDRSVQTVNINLSQLGIPIARTTNPANRPSVEKNAMTVSQEATVAPAGESRGAREDAATEKLSPPVRPLGYQENDADEQWPELDRLVDDFDLLDL